MVDRASGARALAGYDPGKDAAERYPEWVIRHVDLQGVPEVMCPERRVILIDQGQTWAAKRSSLAHAVAHLDLEHVVIGGYLGRRQEAEAEQLAALRLVTMPALADAIRWHGQRWPLVADLLVVDERLLRVRLAHLHPSHRGELDRMLAAHTEGMTA